MIRGVYRNLAWKLQFVQTMKAILKMDTQRYYVHVMYFVLMTGRSFTGMQGVATGWGVTVQNGSPSDVLNEVTVPILSNRECRTTSYGSKKITDNMLCAGFPEGKKDSCQVSIQF
jgi:hypothetical protein